MTTMEYAALFQEKLESLTGWAAPDFIPCHRKPPVTTPGVTRSPFRRLMLLLSGERLFHYSDGTAIVKRRLIPGEILVAEPQAEVWGEEEGNYELLSIVCSYNFIRFVSKTRKTGDPIQRDADFSFHCGRESHDCLNSLLHALFDAAGRDSRETAWRIGSAIFSECLRVCRSKEDRMQRTSSWQLERILAYIESHLDEKLTCGAIGRQLKISSNYIAQLFARHMYCGFTKYIAEQRFELALRLLNHSDLNISEIAASCGYSRTNYFIRTFKERYNCTPCRYRQGKVVDQSRLSKM